MKNKVNYQLLLDQIAEEYRERGRRPRLLLHACCAPCSSAVLEVLSSSFDLTVYYYNPNISTEEEFRRRVSELRRLMPLLELPDIRIVVPDYDHREFLEIAKGLEREPERGVRCLRCYELRLRKTAEEGKAALERDPEEAYDFFCTSLTISPMKDAETLNRIGRQLAEQYGIPFLPSDFKKRGGYQRSVELSREYELYRQDFCGCEFSRAEAEKRRKEMQRPPLS